MLEENNKVELVDEELTQVAGGDDNSFNEITVEAGYYYSFNSQNIIYYLRSNTTGLGSMEVSVKMYTKTIRKIYQAYSGKRLLLKDFLKLKKIPNGSLPPLLG